MLNYVIGIIGVLLIAAGILFLAVKSLGKKGISATLIIVGAVTVVIAMSFSIVPTGYTGVRTTF